LAYASPLPAGSYVLFARSEPGGFVLGANGLASIDLARCRRWRWTAGGTFFGLFTVNVPAADAGLDRIVNEGTSSN
jgi:hypothetical protein